MKKQIILFLLLCILLTGCTSESEKKEILDEHLSKLYDNYSIVDSCSYSNTGGDNELESVVKINDNYVLSSIDLGNELYYSENKLLSHEKYNDMIMIGETTSYYNSTYFDNRNLVLLIDDSIENNKIFEYIVDICLNYSDSAIEVDSFLLDVYYVSSLDNDEEIYKEFVISQTAGRCDYQFYRQYKKRVGIISEFQQYRQWLPTKSSESYKSNYKQFIRETLKEMAL